MQTSLYDNWMRRPLSVAVCPTPDLWPNIPTRDQMRMLRRHTPSGEMLLGLAHGVPLTESQAALAQKETTNMKEATLRILKLLEEGKITADEADRLLSALDKAEAKPDPRKARRKWLHIKVDEAGEKKVDVKVPLALLKFGFKFAPQAAKLSMSNGRHRAAHARLREAKAKARKAKARARREFRSGMREFEEKMRDFDEVSDELGDRIEQTVAGALHETFGDSLEGVEGVLDDNLNIDIAKILKMTEDPDFDGTILEVHDDEDDEHVVITLE